MLTFLAHMWKVTIMMMWNLVSVDLQREYLLIAKLAINDDAVGALAAKVYDNYSDEMARLCHILIHSGATSMLTATRSSIERETLDSIHVASDTAELEATPYNQVVMDLSDYSNPNSNFNKF